MAFDGGVNESYDVEYTMYRSTKVLQLLISDTKSPKQSHIEVCTATQLAIVLHGATQSMN